MRHIATVRIRACLGRRFRAGASGLAVAAAIGCGLLAAPAQAASPNEERVRIEFPAQPLSETLIDLGARTGIAIAFADTELANLSAPKVSGTYSVREILELILKQSGLKYEFIDTRTVRIAQAQTTATDAAPAKPTPAPTPRPVSQFDAPVTENVVVTGTRVIRDGYEAPTPLTVLGIEEIQRAAQVNLAEQISRLPALAGSNNPRSTASNISGGFMGISSLNLRSLGAVRTLVLLDSQRLPAASLGGLVDANSIPSALVQRVDVVTGGASAAWGSDAVAGVVNFVLDKTFTGVKGEVQGGITTYGDDANYKVSLSAGTPFAGGRGHVLASGEIWYNDGIEGMPRPWYRGLKTLFNPAYTATNGQPQYLVREGVGYTTAAPGGIVTSGPLRGLYFGPNGTPAQLNYGSLVSDPFMVGGDWRYTDFGNGPQNLDPTVSHKSVFTRLSYDVADGVQVFGEFSFVQAHTKTTGTPQFNFGGLTITRDNAFLPVEVAARMDALGVASLNVGTWNADIGGIVTETRHDLYRYVVGAEGAFDAAGTSWNWRVVGNRNISKFHNGTFIPVTANYRSAIDAVRTDSGAIVCRSTLTNPGNGCVPLNILGIGVASPAALDYVMGHSYLDAQITQDVVSATLRGEPFSTWAGPVSLALGFEYRREAEEGTSDPMSRVNSYWAGNYKPIHGSFDVKEGFVEVVAPVLKDADWAESLDLNAAVRATDYSSSGYVTTWKVGATYTPVSDIRFRITRSRDIRAGNLSELFQPGQTNTTTLVDPFRNNESYTVFQTTVGNPTVSPEKADSLNLGVIVQPGFLPGFSASVDYFNIDVKGAIASLNAATTINQCYAGNAALCQNINRDSAGLMTEVFLRPINLSKQVARGLDIEANYRIALDSLSSSFGDGHLSVRALATRYLKSMTDNGINPPTSSLGANGSVPKWRYLAQLTYDNGQFTASLAGRGLSSGVIGTSFIECSSNCPPSTTLNPTIDRNRVDGAFYMDASVSYKAWDAAEVFFAVDNIANKDPAPYPPGGTGIGSAQIGISQTYYDVIGRSFRGGLRFKF